MPEIVPTIPDSLECIKLRDCYPARRLYPAFSHFIDIDTGVLDYASQEARSAFAAVDDELNNLGFRSHEISLGVTVALLATHATREFFKYVEEPGDLFTHA